MRKHELEMKEVLNELEVDATESAFLNHEVNRSHFERHQEQSIDFTVWQQEAKDHEQLLSSLKQLVIEEERLTEAHLDLQRKSSEKKQKIDELRQQQEHLERWFTEQKQALTDQVFAWIGQHSELQFSTEQLQEKARLLEGLYENNRYEDVREKLLAAINEQIARLKTEESIIHKAIEDKQQEIFDTETELTHWKTLKMAHPDRAQDTQEFRKT
ncbi:hypothetical protein ACI2OX_04270 [Bacillus sp. N9]